MQSATNLHVSLPPAALGADRGGHASAIRILGTHGARVLYSGPVEPLGIQRLVEQIEDAFSYYQYERVDIEIESPGGSVQALHYLTGRLDRWRRSGRKIGTRAFVCCASAAAVILSLGDHGARLVDRSTMLLYHFGRIQLGSSAITSERARALSRRLDREDERILDHLLGYILGSDEAAAAAWLQRAQARIEWAEAFIRKGGDGAAFVPPDASARLRKLGRMLKSIRRPERMREHVRRHLEALFSLDQPIELFEAWALNLIDGIEDVTP